MIRSIVLILIALVLCSCSKPAVVSSSVSSAEAQALTDSFSRLDKALAAKASVIRTNFAPPASNADITALRTTSNGTTNAVVAMRGT